MKKTLIILYLMTISSLTYAQVGINTPNPQATLDIQGNPALIGSLDGVIAPRVTGAQLRAKTYTANQTGALVYVTLADPTPAGQTINVVRAGYFSFDGIVWQAVTTPPLNLPNGTGTLIVINGQQQVAQEIAVRMSNDAPLMNGINSIGNMTTEMIDNYNSFTGTSTTNSFQVANSGTYMVTMNFSVQPQGSINGNLYYGIYNQTDSTYSSLNLETIQLSAGQVKNLAYSVAIELESGKNYTFITSVDPASNVIVGSAVIRGQLSGNPTSFFGIKRLK